MSFLAEDGIGVRYSTNDLRVGLLLDVLEKLRAGEFLFVRVGLVELAVRDSRVHGLDIVFIWINYKIALYANKEIMHDPIIDKRHLQTCINIDDHENLILR